MDWIEVLKTNEFKMYDRCNCHGQYTEKYTDADKIWRVVVKPKRQVFELYKFSNFKATDFTHNLEKTLIKNGIIIQNIQS